jgi:hypothetical protein
MNIARRFHQKTIVICTLIGMLSLGSSLYAQNASVNENDLFSDTSSVVASSTVVNNAASAEDKPKSTALSGVINSAFIGSANRDWFSDFHRSNLGVTNFIVGNLMLDIRLPQGAKAFANLETQYMPNNSSVLVGLREMFVDGNMKKKVFLRMGKQVLQWGRCSLWNPTDLINVEKKLFIQKIGYREGAYGIKMHIPFGTTYNLYGFLDTKNASSVDSLALAGKFEFLFHGTEMAFSLWDRKSFHPVAGYDISTRLFGLDIAGELSVSPGANAYSLGEKNGVLVKTKSDEWQTKACIDIGRDFDFFKFSHAFTVTGSFYYNGPGSDDNIFADSTFHPYAVPIVEMSPNPSGVPTIKIGGTKKDFLVGNNLYEQHNYSKYYAAVFTSVNRFFISGLSSSLNAVMNLQQTSLVLSGGFTYASLNEFFTGILVSGYIGKKDTEYTFENQALMVQVTVGVTF